MAQAPREQIFISSTFTDLVAERQAVTRAILQAKAFPAGMELFPASDASSWGVIERAIDDSDYYLLIIAGRYGSIDPTSQVSFTEREYTYAMNACKPIMAFIHADMDDIVVGRTDRDSGMAELLEAFKTRVRQDRQVASWTSPAELAGQVVLALNELRQTHPAVGWVRGDQAMTDARREEIDWMSAELAASSERIRELEGLVLPPGLAQGSDGYELSGLVWLRWRTNDDTGLSSERWTRQATWDSILRRLAPPLLQGASVEEIRQRLSEWTGGRVLDIDPADGEPPEDARTEEWVVDEETLYDILFQFDALGLVETEAGTFWTLTPRGRTQLRASAFRSPSPSGATSGNLP